MATVETYEFPTDRWYHPREHLWLLPEPPADAGGEIVRVGLDALGQEMLGEVVYVQLAEPGTAIRRGEAVGSLEAEKMVRPVIAPVTGVVLEANAEAVGRPRRLNEAPYQVWLFRVRATDWASEQAALLHEEPAVVAWARAELAASRS
jgi:glycine cleavage system H protein